MDGEHLPHPARRRLFAARALAGAADGTLGATLAELRAGDRHSRDVALFMALVGRDRAGVLAAIADDDPHIRLRAVLAWAGAPDTAPEPVARYVADAPAHTREQLYRRIRVCRRTDLAEALIDPVRARFGDREAAALLPACGAATAARLLPQLTHALGDRAALTRRFPRLCLEQAGRDLTALPVATRAAWWARHGAGVLQAGRELPHDVLDLLERVAPAESLPGPLRAYGVLVAADPLRVLDLLTAPARAGWLEGSVLPARVLSRLGRLPVAGLAGLGRRLRWEGHRFARLLGAVPPRDREELFTRVWSDVDISRDRSDIAVLPVLPVRLQEAEARRTLGLDEMAQNEDQALPYLAHLPWAEAQERLLAETHRATPGHRATGWVLLIECAALSNDPAAVLAATHQLQLRRNEHDNVRGSAVRALTRVRPALLRPELVEPLEQIVTDVVRARDTSPFTLRQVGNLAVLVLRERFDSPVLVRWALHTFQRLLGDDRVPDLGRLDRRLRRGQEVQAFDAVRGWVQLGVDRAGFEPLFAVARALGERAWRLPGLQSMLERATRRGNLAGVSRTAIALWLADPRQRADRVGAVLREDPSAIALPVVWRAVCTRRDDLLDAALAGPPPAGRFIAAGVRWVPPPALFPRRWLPRHHDAYVERQAEVVRDRGATAQTRAAALRAAAPVPVSGRRLVQRSLSDGDVVVAEAALAALPWTDRPSDALTVLLAHVRDDRARVVVAAAARASLFVPPSVLLAALDPGQGKVTARKAAVRLLAARSVPGAADVLWRVWQDGTTHPDVRIAVVSAARQRIAEPGMWRIVRAAGTGDDRSVQGSVLAVLAADPWLVPAGLRADYAGLVAAAAAGADRWVTVRAWTVLPRWAPWLADMSEAVVSRVTDLSDQVAWPEVMRALNNLVWAGLGEAALIATVRALAAADAADAGGIEGTDRAARRRLESLVQRVALRSNAAATDAPGRHALTIAGQELSAVDSLVPVAATLLLEGADLADPAALAGVLALVAGRPVLAGRLATRLGQRLRHLAADPEVPLRIAAGLAAAPGAAEGLFALAYTTKGAELRWPAPWQAVVQTLRKHPVADVRDAALALDMW